MIARKLFLLILAAPLLALTDDGTEIAGPISGFVYDQAARSLRPVLGVPGASYLGDALASEVDAASIAPDGSAALIVQGGRLFAGAGIRNLAPAWTAVEGSLSDADLFAWSQDSAAVYASATGQAQIVRNSLRAPAASAAIDLSGLPGRVLSMALAGDAVVVGVEGGGVYLASLGNAPKLLAAAQTPVTIAIAGSDLYFADRDGGRIWQIADFAGAGNPQVFAGDLDAPVGLHIAGGRLLAASAGSRQLAVYDLTTHALAATLDLEFTPDTLEPVGARSLALIARAEAGRQPYYVVDTSPDPAVYFVPAGR